MYDFLITNDISHNKPSKEGTKTSDIIKMSQDITGDWLTKEAEKKFSAQVHTQSDTTKTKKK